MPPNVDPGCAHAVATVERKSLVYPPLGIAPYRTGQATLVSAACWQQVHFSHYLVMLMTPRAEAVGF